jgi:glycosyltransferase involved in cell wall biosynthesis
MSPPLISVLLPCYNVATFLRIAIRSILDQTLADFEIIAIDDGSSDGSHAVLQELAKTDPRLKVFRQQNAGIVAALNRALKEARGHYLARMDGDDISYPERFARQVALLDERKDLAVVGCGYHLIDQEGHLLATRKVRADLPQTDIFQPMPVLGTVCHPTAMMRREVLEQVGGYRDVFRFAEDLDLWCRIGEIGNIGNVTDPLFAWRRHLKRTSIIQIRAQLKRHVGAVVAAQLRRSGQSDAFLDQLDFADFSYDLFHGKRVRDYCHRYELMLRFQRPEYDHNVPYDHRLARRYFAQFIGAPQPQRKERIGASQTAAPQYDNQSWRTIQRVGATYFKRGDIKGILGIGRLLLRHSPRLLGNLASSGSAWHRFVAARSPTPVRQSPIMSLPQIDQVKARLLAPTYSVRFHGNREAFDHAHQTFHFLRYWPLVYAECSKNACSTMKWALYFLEGLSRPYFSNIRPESIHIKEHTGFAGRQDMPDDIFVERLISGGWLRVCVKRNPYERVYSAWNDKLRQAASQCIRYDRSEYSRWLSHIHAEMGLGPPTDPARRNLDFPCFVDYLAGIEKSAMDRHWYPQVDTLHADLIDYDIIGDVANMGQFALEIHKRLDCDHLMIGHLLRRHNRSDQDGGHSSRWKQAYTQELAKKVYRIYRDDFDWGGYAAGSWKDG